MQQSRYAHKNNESENPDLRWLDRLLEQLAPLVNQGLVEVWSDKKLETGDNWHERIQESLSQATVAVLLVSPSFLASAYITNSEMPVLLRQARKKGLTIIPLILRPCENLIEVLKTYMPLHVQPDDYVFTTPNRAPISVDNFYHRDAHIGFEMERVITSRRNLAVIVFRL